MRSKTTVLRAQRDREFLAAQRRDPVTGRVFVVGDQITLCATCLLPFLKASWDGMGGAHCGQSSSAGIQQLEISTEAPLKESDSGDAEVVSEENGEPASQVKSGHLGLMPMPIELLQIPVALR